MAGEIREREKNEGMKGSRRRHHEVLLSTYKFEQRTLQCSFQLKKLTVAKLLDPQTLQCSGGFTGCPDYSYLGLLVPSNRRPWTVTIRTVVGRFVPCCACDYN